MENSKIEWCDHTFNPWEGCTKKSPGCKNCYALTRNKRFAGGANWGPGAPRRRTTESNWRKPLRWNRDAERRHVSQLHSWPAGKPLHFVKPRVFCASLADWLDEEVPIEWLADLLALIHATPYLDWLLLTKRPENWRERIGQVVGLSCVTGCSDDDPYGRAGWLANRWQHGNAPANVWIGTTVEDQARAEERIPLVLDIPARVRFLSCEPLLQHLLIKWWLDGNHASGRRPDWVIAGGESGPGARPMDPAWAQGLRDQCAAAGVPFFMKQMGGVRKPFPAIPEDMAIRQFPVPVAVS